MDAANFNQMSLTSKHQLIEEKGKVLMHRYHLNYFIELYFLDNLYVEIWRSIATEHICWIQPQNEEYVLNTYKELIHLLNRN